jgi:hypothetical protein
MENKIPTHDPYTGELNPYYEELTGEKNPLISDNKDNNYCFDLSSLIGKEFRYNGKYGLSNWTDKVKNVETNMGIHTNWTEALRPLKEGEDPKKFEIYGHIINLYVRSTRGNYLYELENCIFVEY